MKISMKNNNLKIQQQTSTKYVIISENLSGWLLLIIHIT